MKTQLIRIGNSFYIRLPESLLEKVGIVDEVEITLIDAAIVVVPAGAHSPRRGWAEAAERLGKAGDGGLLDPVTPTLFDETEWEW